MKECKQCSCNLPDDYDLDICPVCLEDSDGLMPDSYRAFEEEKNHVLFANDKKTVRSRNE